ncbi:MAG: ABC transporter, partial [Chloroflexota bacterium]
FKLLSLTLREPKSADQLEGFGIVSHADGLKATIQVPRGRATAVASQILGEVKVDDLLIEDPPVEDVIRQIFTAAR